MQINFALYSESRVLVFGEQKKVHLGLVTSKSR